VTHQAPPRQDRTLGGGAAYPGFGKGRHTVSKCTHQIIMSFSTPVVGCLLKKGLQKGAHGYPRTSLATPVEGYFIIWPVWGLDTGQGK